MFCLKAEEGKSVTWAPFTICEGFMRHKGVMESPFTVTIIAVCAHTQRNHGPPLIYLFQILAQTERISIDMSARIIKRQMACLQ